MSAQREPSSRRDQDKSAKREPNAVLGAVLRYRIPRRLLTIPAVILAFVLVAASVPFWALGAIALSPWLPGRWRPLRFAWFAGLWLGLEVAAVAALGWLWLVHGAGRRLGTRSAVDAHYRLLRALLGWLSRSAQRLFAVAIKLEDAAGQTPPMTVLATKRRPLLVLARHAGPGDSLLLVHELVAVYHRKPRIVLKDTLQLDPTIDLLVNRLPSRFISPQPRDGSNVAATVGTLADGMDGDDALLIFPEGGNFTERRRQRSIAKLEASGRAVHAALARRMRHLVAPRPGGVLAALDAAPDADVVFVAHTGLEQLNSVLDLWRGLPMDREVRARFWTVPAADVPVGRDERISWLFEWWGRIDSWIEAQQPSPRQSPSGR